MSDLQRSSLRIMPTGSPSFGLGVVGTLLASAVFNAVAVRRAERSNPPRGSFIRVDGLWLHLLDSGGNGEPIILLHGNGATSADMDVSGLVSRLSIEHRVIAVDRPGYGYSERPRGRSWTPEAQADLIAASLDQLEIERCVVLGHSWGALVAAAMALRHPERVSKLVLVSGYFFPTLRVDAVLASPAAVPIIGDLMRETVTPLLARLAAKGLVKKMFAPREVPGRFWREFPLELGFRPSQLRASQEESAMMVPAARRLSPHYESITCPVSIIAGRDDQIVDTRRQSIALHDVVRQSKIRVVPSFGHMVHYATSDVVADEAHLLPGSAS
jgi:pimeloyl-ACP methyl ester carboxylesterase